ncbi:MAG TPA: LysR substrate-binding domain-containing protein [Solirubrobacteraceae bacterium]|nr:LysR substrate-binding domain-containing protein [Solirubrobacteraceae bacterium]
MRYFVAVAEELHFRRAAARLHISQPPLSQQVRQLEEELGTQLLIRNRRRVELTAAGEAFLRDARVILGELDGAVGTAQRIGSGQAGRLRINFVGSALVSIIPAAVQAFRRDRPGVEVEMRERPTAEQLRAVRSGSVDLGFVRPPIDDLDGLRAEVVLREPTVAVLPSSHPLAEGGRISMSRLAGEPLVLFPRSQASGYHDLLISALARGGPPRVVQYAPEMTTIVGLVAAGLGVSLVPRSVERLALGGVSYRPVPGAPVSELVAVARQDDDAPLVRAFIEQARAEGGS